MRRVALVSERRKRALLIAYWFPPAAGPAVTRTAGQVRYLPEAGWDVTAVTVHPRLYPATDETRLSMVQSATVITTPSWEPAQWATIRRSRADKHGHTPTAARQPVLTYRLLRAVRDMCFVPDERIGWIPPAVWAALRACQREKPDVLWAVGGPFSALLVGLIVHRLTGVPLVAEFHDGWLDNPYFPPRVGWRRAIEAWQERAVLRAASAVLCAPPG